MPGNQQEVIERTIADLELKIADLQQQLMLAHSENAELSARLVALKTQLRQFYELLTRIHTVTPEPPSPETTDQRFKIVFNAANASADMTYTDPRTKELRSEHISQPRYYWLLRHVVLCARNHIQTVTVPIKIKGRNRVPTYPSLKRFHPAWAAYLTPDTPMDSSKHFYNNFRVTVAGLNALTAQVLTGDKHNQNAFLLQAEQPGPAGTHCYCIRLDSEVFISPCITNIGEVDLYLRERTSLDSRQIRKEQLRCDRAIARICPGGKPSNLFAKEELACEAAQQIQELKDRLGRPPEGWVVRIQDLVVNVQALQDTWRLGQPGTVLQEVLADLATELSTDVLLPLKQAVGEEISNNWEHYILESLFKASKYAQPEIWEADLHALDYFRFSLPVHILGCKSMDNDRAAQLEKTELNKQTVIYYGDLALAMPITITDRKTLLKVFSWMLNLGKPDGKVLQHPNIRDALRWDWMRHNQDAPFHNL